MDEDKRKHLEFIQNVIGRMANTSFIIKGWSVTIVAASFALAQKETDQKFTVIAFGVALLFWGLDGYFLLQEKLYRELFKEVAVGKVNNFDMDATKYEKKIGSCIGVFVSPTLLFFHGVLTGSSAIVVLST